MVSPGAPASCAACGRPTLHPHLKVAGDAGAQGLIPTTDRYGTSLADIARCSTCGHMQLDPLPDADTLAGAYSEAESLDYLEEEPGQRATAQATLARLAGRLRAVGKPPQLLDIGCWLGFLLDEARRRGWSATGLEPSRFASAYARDRLGLDVRTTDLEHAGLTPGSFDAFVMADVIEHLLDPGRILDRLSELGREDALLYLALPDAGSRVARVLGSRWWSILPTHVHYFTRHSLAVLLRRHGWEVLEMATAPKVFSVRYYLARLNGYSPTLARVAIRASQAAGVADRLVGPDFRDRLGVVARRRTAVGVGHE